MNDNKNYLSLGNIFNLIKDISNNKNTAMQSEIFCSLFNVCEINNTTVNNYCIGYRPIGIEYKKVYIDLKQKCVDDYSIFIPIILSLLSILEEHIYKTNDNSLDIINNNFKLNKLCQELLEIAENDEHIDSTFINKINKLLDNNNLYEAIIEFLSYAIIDNIQPLYIQDINIKINKQELEDYLKVKLYEGISYITSLQELSKKNNMYACAELGSLEFDGLLSGKVNYEKSYEYYLKASSKNHPKACWMVANLILTNRIGKIDYYFDIAWEYLNKAVNLDSSAALNTMGNCYLNGLTPDKKRNKNKAIYYYKQATELGYVYAYNNLGKIAEADNNMDDAIKYYEISADLGESWALNKVGEYHRKKNDLKRAFVYYLKSSQCPIKERNYYSYYNLAKYYYLKEDKTKAIEYLTIASNNDIKEAKELLNAKDNNRKPN